MRNPLALLTYMLLLFYLSSTFQMKMNLPIPKVLITRLNLSIRRLEMILPRFDSPVVNKTRLLQRVDLTYKYLIEMNKALNKFNNVIVGAHVAISGNKNLVVGSYNTLKGNNNWVFVPNYKGQIDGDLVIQKWKIQMDKKQLILTNPKLAISYLNQQKNIQYKNRLKSNIKNPARVAVLPNVNLKKSHSHKKLLEGTDDTMPLIQNDQNLQNALNMKLIRQSNTQQNRQTNQQVK